MARFRLYADCLALSEDVPRSELTRKVVSHWMCHDDLYETEFPQLERSPEKYLAYWNYSAERVLLRRYVLGHPVSEILLEAPELKTARPFGMEGPTYADVSRQGIKMAMVCLPLACPADPKGAVMARLYCVKGLRNRKVYRPPFRQGDGRFFDGYAWFLTGVPSGREIDGKSWQLAARLLVRVLDSDSLELRKRLAKDFTATGSVDEKGRLHKINLVDKLFLAERCEFKRLKWILPLQNDAEAKGLNAMLATSFEMAWKSVETQMSSATGELITLVKKGVSDCDLPRIRELLRAGADANACEVDTGRNARQYLMLNVRDKITALIRKYAAAQTVPTEAELSRAIFESLDSEWQADKICSYYGNRPLHIFQLAREAVETGDCGMLKEYASRNDINATDRDGETALDFAKAMDDVRVINVLCRRRAEERIYKLSSRKMRMMLRDPTGTIRRMGKSAALGFLLRAFRAGLNPLELTVCTTSRQGVSSPYTRRVWDNLLGRMRQGTYDPWQQDSFVQIEYSETSLLQEAILASDLHDGYIERAQPLVEFCLEQLVRRPPVQTPKIRVSCGKDDLITTYPDLARRFSSPAIAGLVRKTFADLKLCK